MKNGQVCCILGVCCNRPAKKVEKMAELMALDGVCSGEEALKVSRWVVFNFDLAPAGSLTEFVKVIADQARSHEKD